jgi:hypothetical protein
MPVSLRWLLVLGILLLSAALRLHQLDDVALRGDEAFTVIHWAQTPFTENWFDLVQREPHPFPIFLTYWAWTELVGSSELAVRLLPVFSSLAGTAGMMALTRLMLGRWWVALLAGVLWTLNPFLLYHAQDARNFSSAALFAVLAVYWFLRALRHPAVEQSLRPWIPYIIVQVLGVYVYFFELFTVAVVGMFWLGTLRTRPGLLGVGGRVWSAIAVLLMPIALQFYAVIFVSDYEGTAVTTEIMLLFEQFIPTLWFGFNTTNAVWGLVFLMAVMVGGMVLHREMTTLIALWVALPLLALTGVSYFSAVFRPRYIIHVVPAFILALLMLTFMLPRRFEWQRMAQMLPVLAVLMLSTVSYGEIRDYFLTDPPKAPDWRGLTDYLEARTTEHDVIITAEADPAIEYYFDGNIYYLPTDDDNPTTDFAQLLENYDAVYVLSGARTGPAGQYFQQNAQLIPGDTYLGVFQVRRWEVAAREIAVPLNVQFGDVARLHGYTVLQGARDGAILLLYWEPLRQTATEYSILTHVVAAGGDPFAQPVLAALDHGIAGSTISTTSWTPGVIIRDVVAVPASGAEAVQVLVGMYETTNPDILLPLLEADSMQEENRRYVLPSIVESSR